MELAETIEISGEEREIADAYAREQCAANAQNIATNAEGITGLNDSLDTLSYGENGGSANLFDKSKIVRDAGIGSDGSPYGDKGWGYSDYIHVEPNTEYTFMNVSWFNYYDANKSHISQSTGGTNTTPSNAKYVIVSFQLSVVNFVMVAKFHQTEYVPYVMSNKQLTQANENLDQLKNDLIVLETTSTIDMTASRELDDITSAALTIPSGYKPIAMFGYNEENNNNISAIPLLVRSDGKVLFHAKNHSTSDQGIIHFRIRVTFKKMS